jgi:hypothetical protein
MEESTESVRTMTFNQFLFSVKRMRKRERERENERELRVLNGLMEKF